MNSRWRVFGARTVTHWRVPLAAVALMLGSLGAVLGGAGAAGAATTTSPPGTPHPRPGGAVGGFQPGGLIRAHGSTATATRGVRNGSTTSTNWSGYVLTGGSGAFTSVSSSWTEPAASCSSGTQYAAFWVGLDGYNSDSVEQTGSDSDCSGGTPDYYGWYEMYPADPVYFTNPGAPPSAQGPLPLADFGTINYSGASANGTSMSSQDPTSITMVGGSGNQLDSTGAIDGSGDFSNTWQAASGPRPWPRLRCGLCY